MNIPAAIALQRELAGRVVARDDFGPLRRIAGVDIAVGGGRARAAVTVLGFPGLELLEERTAERPLEFPYVPGLLAFRELPSILEAMEQLQTKPDLVMADGQGVAHPRRCGLASHLGLVLELPSIGCAKSRLIGTHAEPARARGSWRPLRDGGETIGAAVRTREGTRVVYVSVGHRVSLASAIRIVLECSPRYRVPQPTRLADQATRKEAPCCRPATTA